MDTAIDHSKDAWWDPTQQCVMTKADAEMQSILQANQDLIFPEKKVIFDLPKPAMTQSGSSQSSDDMLLTSSISTFRMKGTTQTRTTHKSKGKVKLPTATNTVTSNTDTTLSGSTFTKKDISFLLSHIMQALQLQNNATQLNVMPPGGNTTGHKK